MNKTRTVSPGKVSFKVSLDYYPLEGRDPQDLENILTSYWEKVDNKLWEPETYKIFDRFLDNTHSYLDIGAWMGPTALYGSQIASHCYALEPDPIAFKMLKNNLDLNETLKEKLSLYEIAIGDSNKMVTFGNRHNNFGRGTSSLLSGDLDNAIKVESSTLENFITKNKIEDLNFIKMDIEGGETLVLPQSSEFLSKVKPTIHLSLHPFWFKHVQEDSTNIYSALNIYKNIYDNNGNTLSEKNLMNKLLGQEEFDIVVTELNW